jgi:hypothetical protein
LISLLNSGFDIKKPSTFLLERVIYFINDQNLSQINNFNAFLCIRGLSYDQIINSFNEMRINYAQVVQLSKYLSSQIFKGLKLLSDKCEAPKYSASKFMLKFIN